MVSNQPSKDLPFQKQGLADAATDSNLAPPSKESGWKKFFGGKARQGSQQTEGSETSTDGEEDIKAPIEKWSLGVLNDKFTDEVPGSILLMSNANRNEPLGLENAPARRSASSLPSPYPASSRSQSSKPPQKKIIPEEKKTTKDGKLILEPQPDASLNDPLNWPSWRRDVALISLGFFCMLGGGMTPVLAAGFSNVAQTYDVSIPRVALTTGLYMMGLGLGSVFASPTAILYGKRPVYLVGIILFALTSIWCALSPTYTSLVIARIVMGFSVSPCECLPSATIAEIFYLHERAYRLGIYTLLLLSGKNLVPLVSAAIIESLDWRWVFWIVAIVVGFCWCLVFLFVPETFWDRTPQPHHKSHKALASMSNIFHHHHHHHEKHSEMDVAMAGSLDVEKLAIDNDPAVNGPNAVAGGTIAQRRHQKNVQHVGFAEVAHHSPTNIEASTSPDSNALRSSHYEEQPHDGNIANSDATTSDNLRRTVNTESTSHVTQPPAATSVISDGEAAKLPRRGEGLKASTPSNRVPSSHGTHEKAGDDYLNFVNGKSPLGTMTPGSSHSEPVTEILGVESPIGLQRYTSNLRNQPPRTYKQTLKPWNGRLAHDTWLRVAFRPFILFAYPSILWSTLVYSLSIGWLIVLSESVTTIFRTKDTYNFTPLQAGLVYISPFIGGILGTAVAGKLSDIIVRYMSRRNGGIYEPEFRLVMAIPVTLSTVIGLMGYGWSAQEKDNFMVPTVFFGIISFGCSLGSTTAITFAVDSYRQYAGEALVTLNFSKNIFHGLVFSLFFNYWLDADGAKNTFIAVGGIQIACLLTTIPMYIYGKRARMWTVRKNLMEKF